ncbi:hypothetical protein AB0L59_23990 [Streptomyces sp. NPDC052109]|uniref:hypothetical protein n=1 Tax=Streptomyces sp. NPDC052109 TaxID=3155527 RepID=UPI0034217C31
MEITVCTAADAALLEQRIPAPGLAARHSRPSAAPRARRAAPPANVYVDAEGRERE